MQAADIYLEARTRGLVHDERLRADLLCERGKGAGIVVVLSVEYANFSEHAERRRRAPFAAVVFDGLDFEVYRSACDEAAKRFGQITARSLRAANIAVANALILRNEARVIFLHNTPEGIIPPKYLATLERLRAVREYRGETLQGIDRAVSQRELSHYLSRLKQEDCYDPAWLRDTQPRHHGSWKIALAKEALQGRQMAI